MTLDEVLAALRRGHCSEAKAREAGCDLCVARYDAITQVEAWHAEFAVLREAATEMMERAGTVYEFASDSYPEDEEERFLAAEKAIDAAIANAQPTAEAYTRRVQAAALLPLKAYADAFRSAAEYHRERASYGGASREHHELCLSACDAAHRLLAEAERIEKGGADLPRYAPPTTFLALDGTETPIEAAVRAVAEEHAAPMAAAVEGRGVAGDRCEVGNECGRAGCPECQP